MNDLQAKIRQCMVCKDHLPCRPRPVVQLSSSSGIIIVGQAPGKRVHDTGVPWNDASGRTLRRWMDMNETVFYDPELVSVMPMGFCYPGKGRSGDLAPRRECAPLWHDEILRRYPVRPLMLLIGQYAQRYYLKEDCRGSLTETVRNFRQYLPLYFPLPHPSPRNQNWLKINPWFMEEVIPELREEIRRRGVRC